MGAYERIKAEEKRIRELQEVLKNGGKLEPELPSRTEPHPTVLEAAEREGCQ